MYRTSNMDGGYINEGGQLKSKNGQKYVVNQRKDGFFMSKGLAVISGLVVLVLLLAVFLITYFLLAPKCSTAIENTSNGNGIIANGKSNGGGGAAAAAAAAAAVDSNEEQFTAKSGVFPFVTKTGNDIVVSDQPKKEDDIILYDGWSPTIYKLLMEPNFNTKSTKGKAIINIRKDPDTENTTFVIQPIVLDIKNITIHDVHVAQINSTKKIEFDHNYGPKKETYRIQLKQNDLAETAQPIELEVQLQFTSSLTDTLQGFYRTSYVNSYTGKTESLASTQFSPIDARRAFPCFDRPDKKAQFQISIIREEDKTMTLSNMPSSFISLSKPGYVQEDFDITPKMSTYLVAFIVSDLVNTNVTNRIYSPDLPHINIWTRREVSEMTDYVYQLTTKILPFYEQYFGLRFQLPKIDMVAVPDFGFNAMENWGLITFRESAMLVPQNETTKSSAEHTENVAIILAHELAHQWFGNLVTMKWWDDLWLKEGFSTYMSYLAINHINPSWGVFDSFALDNVQSAMLVDSDKSAHPISFPVTKSSDIRRIFDAISYSKGASIIRMMNGFLGDKAFTGGIREFLRTYQYSNAIHDDLCAILTKHGHAEETLSKDLNVKEIMDTWTQQAGYPVVTVTRNAKNITISQQRYMLPMADLSDTSRWSIPITFETKTLRGQNLIPSYWLHGSENLTISDIVDIDHWLYVNVKRSGYYRVNYDWYSWITLHRNVNELPPSIKAQLIDDSLNLARAEFVSYDIPLTFLLSLTPNYDDVLPWAAAYNGLKYITFMLTREAAYENYRAIMRYMLRPVYDSMGFKEQKNESHVFLMHRQRIVEYACFFGYDRCMNAAQLEFRAWMRDKANSINPNLKAVIYCTALREGSYQEWYFAYNRYLETTSASEKELILSALGCTTKPWLLSKYLNMSISSISGIRKQDGARVFASIAKNNIGYELAFDFLMTNIKEISEYFGDGFSTLSKMIQSVTTYMTKEYQKKQFENFAKKAKELELTSIENTIQLALEQVRNNIHWRTRSYYKLHEFLQSLVTELHINLY